MTNHFADRVEDLVPPDHFWATEIPGRSEGTAKIHTSLQHARSALSYHRSSNRRLRGQTMKLYEYKDGNWKLLDEV